MGYYETVSQEAKNAAKEYTINPDKEAAFIKGVTWVINKLERMSEGDSMESMMDADTIVYLNKLKIADVRKLCSEIKKFEERS